jgi:hypothetical protein
MFFSLGKKSEKLWQRYSIYLKITNLQISKFAKSKIKYYLCSLKTLKKENYE